MTEAYGFEPRRRINCACGYGKIANNLRAALAIMQWHREIGCEGCDHVMSLEEVRECSTSSTPSSR
jgi:hypothetical protein